MKYGDVAARLELMNNRTKSLMKLASRISESEEAIARLKSQRMVMYSRFSSSEESQNQLEVRTVLSLLERIDTTIDSIDHELTALERRISRIESLRTRC